MRCLTRHLMQIHAETVVLRVAVKEGSKLQQHVWAVFNAGDHAAGGKRSLLDIAVVVLRVFVKDEFAEFVHLGGCQ